MHVIVNQSRPPSLGTELALALFCPCSVATGSYPLAGQCNLKCRMFFVSRFTVLYLFRFSYNSFLQREEHASPPRGVEQRVVYSIYYNGTLVLPWRGERGVALAGCVWMRVE